MKISNSASYWKSIRNKHLPFQIGKIMGKIPFFPKFAEFILRLRRKIMVIKSCSSLDVF